MANFSLISVILMVKYSAGKDAMNVIYPTAYNCNNVTGSLTKESETLYIRDTPVKAGEWLTVATEMNVNNYATLRFYVCPSKIPEKIQGPWKFNCKKRIKLDINVNYSSALLEMKLLYYFNVGLTRVKIPSQVRCDHCGLQIEAEFKEKPDGPPYAKKTACSFIKIW